MPQRNPSQTLACVAGCLAFCVGIYIGGQIFGHIVRASVTGASVVETDEELDADTILLRASDGWLVLAAIIYALIAGLFGWFGYWIVGGTIKLTARSFWRFRWPWLIALILLSTLIFGWRKYAAWSKDLAKQEEVEATAVLRYLKKKLPLSGYEAKLNSDQSFSVRYTRPTGGESPIGDLQGVNVRSLVMESGSLDGIEKIPSLRTLDLSYGEFDDEDVRHVEHLPNLVELDLRGTKVSRGAVARLRKALPDCQIKPP